MKKSLFYYKELTPAEVGKTGTHEVYIRMPNHFNYTKFFGNSAIKNRAVIEVHFSAQDITNGGNETIPLRFVYFINSNKEKRIPSLGQLFKKHNVQVGDIVSLESRNNGTSISYYLCFYKKGEIEVNPGAIYFSRIEREDIKESVENISDFPLQQIFYGAPGSGKSFIIKKKYEMKLVEGKWVEDEEKKAHVIRTTFHPDTDYASFVGCYKPITYEVENEKKIKYDFVPQAFTEAYVKAWNDLDSQYYLILEEINRGNCAQIFGDLFQLLDRNSNGRSEYPINADTDLRKYLEEAKDEDGEDILYNKEGIKDGKLCLPPNLSIIASMNTSDQSLFPMDSAFKRRWSWKYVPIEYDNKDSREFEIDLEGKKYSWPNFLLKINEEIKKCTYSEDKQMGNFFIKQSIGVDEFKDKVMFYLWSEIGKENYKQKDAIFFYNITNEKEPKEFSFNELYGKDDKVMEILEGFMDYIDKKYNEGDFKNHPILKKNNKVAVEQNTEKAESELQLTAEE